MATLRLNMLNQFIARLLSTQSLAVLAATYLLLSATPLESDPFQRFGITQIDRYTPRQSGIDGAVRSIDVLPNGDLAILTQENLITFNGTFWELEKQLKGPMQLLNTGEGYSIIAHANGVSKVEADSHGRNRFTRVTPEDFNLPSVQAPRSVATARGHIFTNHGRFLTEVAPDGTTRFHQLESWASSVFAIDDELYFTGGNESLLNKWNWETQELIHHQQMISGSAIGGFIDVTPRKSGGVWMLSKEGNIVGFDGEKTWQWAGNAALPQIGSDITSLLEVSREELAIATSNDGIFIFNKQGGIVRSVSRISGLDSDRILEMASDSQNGLWIATKRSVNRINLEPETLLFDERHGISETVEAIEQFNRQIVLGTPKGIYVANEKSDKGTSLFSLKYKVEGITDLLTYKDHLFAAGERLVAIKTDGSQTALSDQRSYALWQPSAFPDTLLVGKQDGVYISRFIGGQWRKPEKLEGSDREVYGFAESKRGTLMGSNGDNSVTRIHISETNGRAERIALGSPKETGLTMVTAIDGVIYTNTKPALKWDEEQGAFVAEQSIEYFKGEGPLGFTNTFADGKGNVWANVNKSRGLALKRPNRSVSGEISRIDEAINSRAKSLYYDESGRAWAGGNFGLILAKNPSAPSENEEVTLDIHRLLSLKDNVELSNRPSSEGTLKLKHNQNSLRVEASLSSFQSPSYNLFQIYIQGLDTDPGNFDYIPFREFTNLSSGAYKIVINSLSASGQASSFELPISIAAPWHKQNWAYILYAILTLGLLLVLFRAYNLNQVRRRKKLEQLIFERTEEAETQNEQLEQKTEELTATTETLKSTLNQLQETQDQLLDTARTAGKAEIAINVLHNVGNVLNSLNVSINLVAGKIESSKVANLSRVVNLIESHRENIDAFLTQDPRGKAVPDYLIRLSEALDEEVEALKHELAVMSDDINHIKSIIAAQQAHAKNQGFKEELDIRELCENALSILGNDISRSNLEIINDVPLGLKVEGDKHKLLDIVLNLVTNAREAIHEENPPIGVITFQAEYTQELQSLDLHIKDNGSGIDSETKEKLFRHGFTTKADGHGFGLHSCANSAHAMGGKLTLDSAGKHKGATATLRVPRFAISSVQKTDTNKAVS